MDPLVTTLSLPHRLDEGIESYTHLGLPNPVLLKMPGSSLVEELTSAVVGIQSLLAKIEETPALAHINQPL